MLKIGVVAVATLLTTTAFGHVHLLTPTGNDVLESGSTYEISWQITITHDIENWDLYVTTNSQKGPWETIELDLPVGDNSQNSIHTYDWVVPDTPSKTVWIRIVMDNTNGFYDDTNDLPFSIIEAAMCEGDINDDGDVSVADLLIVIDQWGLTDSSADITGDGIVDVSDLLMVVGNWGPCG